ncbi:aspartyl protease family protein [Roseibacillus persicicus]|uniref:aspartyl protease family protein n=1 Tax=Roseibacillus persicicus TaxID=454148 RepID=UPI00398ACF5B
MFRKVRSHLFFLLPALFLVACANKAPENEGVGPSSGLREARLTSLGYTALPLKKISRDSRYSGKFLVNGSPVDLLIDSGANSTDLDSHLAPKLGLRIDNSAKVVSRGALGRPVTSRVGLGVLSAGPVSALPFPFMLANETLGNTATSRYDGQIGLDALEALGALIDLRTGKMWVPSKNAQNARAQSIRPLGEVTGLGFNTLHMRPAKNLPHLIMESYWNGRLVTWIVDTGAEVSVLSAESARELGLETRASSSRIIDASGDNAAARAATFENVVFDRLVVTEFQVAVIELPVVRKNFKDRNGRVVDGIIGMDFLENTGALFDAGSRLLYVGDPATKGVSAPVPTLAKESRREAALGLNW